MHSDAAKLTPSVPQRRKIIFLEGEGIFNTRSYTIDEGNVHPRTGHEDPEGE